ncbi:hypothetical protein ACETIH_07770 [Microvirga arabica]|uniref:Uncharacterized protein n=1 Tax=Microvirga arabica TaxID=1128671 RepID=A0ABV6Y5S9_9HYPH
MLRYIGRRILIAIPTAEHAMREHLELVREGLLKVMTSPLPDRVDGQIRKTPVTASTKKEIRHGT